MIESESHVPQIWNGHMQQICPVGLYWYLTGWAWEYVYSGVFTIIFFFLQLLRPRMLTLVSELPSASTVVKHL